jgi:ADP-ribose pyrophosphatase
MLVEKTISAKQIYDGAAVKLRVETVEKSNGHKATREIVQHADCIAAVVLDNHNHVLLVNQFRKAVGRALLEIPAGGIDPGEEPIEAVTRELQEEIGYRPGKIDKLGGFYSAPGYCTEYLHLYVATNLTRSRLHAEDTDSIDVVKVPLSDIPDMIASGDICDAKSVAGLLRVIHLGMQGE